MTLLSSVLLAFRFGSRNNKNVPATFFYLLILAISAFASLANSEDFPLSFPAQLNGLTASPQQFEYALLNEDQLQIGDVKLDGRRIKFQLIQNQQGLVARARFSWPGGLFDEGEVVIRDSAGKLIWSQNIGDRQAHLPAKKLPDEQFRESSTSLETDQDVQNLAQEILLYPFFRACVQRRDGSTQIYICSTELYLKKVGRRLEILERQIQRPNSYVEVNGRIVSRQGILVLNSPDELISFRSLLGSGASIEISTRTQEVQFNNAFLSADKKQIVVRASGAHPVHRDSDKLKDLANGEWEIRLDAERPLTYLEGAGQIPMKQEFSVNEKLMQSPIQATLVDPPLRTSSSSIAIQVKTDPKFELKGTAGSKMKKIDPGIWQWSLNNLQLDQQNSRKLTLLNEGQAYTAEYKIERIANSELTAQVLLPLGIGLSYSYFDSQKWIAHIDLESDLYNRSLKGSSLKPRVFYQFQPSKFHKLPSNGLGFGFDLIALKSKDEVGDDVNFNGTLFAIDYFHEEPLNKWGPFNLAFGRFQILPLKLSGDFSLQLSYAIEAGLRSWLSSNLFIETKANYRRLTLKTPIGSSFSAQTAQAALTLGFQF